MSVMYCHDCDVHIDTDFNVEHFNSEGLCARHYIGTRKIVTSHDYPPIPTREMDWSATSEDYDADLVAGEYVGSHPVGHGPTEEAAIDDFLEQMEAVQ